MSELLDFLFMHVRGMKEKGHSKEAQLEGLPNIVRVVINEVYDNG